MASSHSENSPEYVDAWVWIHVPEWSGLEELLWEALESLKTGNYTLFLQDPKTIDNQRRFLVMKATMKPQADLEKRSRAVEAQLRDDIDEMLKVLERERGAYGVPLSDDDDDDADLEVESESDHEPKSRAQLRPKFSSPVPSEVGSEAGDPTPMASDDGDDFYDAHERNCQPKQPGDESGSESDVDTDDILGAQSDDETCTIRAGNEEMDESERRAADELHVSNQLRARNDRRRVGNVYRQSNSTIPFQGDQLPE